jgi:prephenate dehydratase
MTEQETIQRTIGYLGSPGSDAEQTLYALWTGANPIPYRSLSDLFQALDSAAVDFALTPIERVRTGSLAQVYDLLARYPVTIRAEWLQTDQAAEHAGGAQEVSGYEIVAEEIPVFPGDTTRFLLLEHGTWERERTAVDDRPGKTSVLIAVDHHPGALVRALSCFSRLQLNLVGIESRPSPGRPWEYLFFVDVDGYAHDPKLRAALKELSRLHSSVRVLGSYPAAGALFGASEGPAGRITA